MNKLKPTVLLVAILLFGAMTSQVIHADSVLNRSTTVILVDREALAQSTGGPDHALSFVGLVTNLQQGHHITYVDAADPANFVGPARVGDPGFKKFEEQVKASLSSSTDAGNSNIVAALGSVYNFLDGRKAKAGSSVYVVTGGSFDGGISGVSDQIALISNLYDEQDWVINGVRLENSSSVTDEMLNRFSEGTGGQVFELSVPDGLKSIAETLIRNDALGPLEDLGGGTVSSSEVFTAPLNIAPGTRETTMLFFKQDTFGSLRLSNPEGLEAADGDRAISSVVELPHAVIWKLVEPVSGQWKVDVRGAEGSVSAWQFTSNKFSVGLASFDSIPFDEPTTLTAFVTDGQEKVTLDGVEVFATISTPDGRRFEQTLNDEGLQGDSVAGDGFFSAAVPPLGVKGDYGLSFELSWPQFERSVVSQARITAQAFPKIDVIPIQIVDIRPGQRVKVATATVNVEGQPYAVSTSEISKSITSDDDPNGIIELVPLRLLEQGRAWEFDVFFTPSQQALHTLILTLDTEYAGREFSLATGSVVLSSLMPTPPVEPVPAPPAAVIVPSEPAPPAQVEVAPSPSLPMQIVVIPVAVLLILVLLAAIYWLSRTRPYGYIYTDRNELVADLSKLKRSAIRSLLSRNAVTGEEIGAKGLERVLFRFSGGSVGVASDQVTPTIRVNNQPLVGETNIQDRTWIGAHGKLYSFLMSPLISPQHPQPMVGDD